MHNMKPTKNNNLISDEQLLRFSDAALLGASFDKAFADAGFFLSNKKEYAELQAYAALEGKLKSMKTSISPDAVFVEKLLAKLDANVVLPVVPLTSVTMPDQALKSPYVGAFDRMMQLAARPSWKVAAPIMVMFLALSTILGVSARRDSSVVLSSEMLVTSNNTEPNLAMRSKTLVTNSADAIPSISTIMNDATQSRMVLTQAGGEKANVTVADSTPETLDGVFALLEQESVVDLSSMGDTDAYTVLDASVTNSLTQPYDETTI